MKAKLKFSNRCVGRKAESRVKLQSQVMAGELTKIDQDLPEINWKFIKNQEWGWDWNERPEDEKVSWAGLEKGREESAAAPLHSPLPFISASTCSKQCLGSPKAPPPIAPLNQVENNAARQRKLQPQEFTASGMDAGSTNTAWPGGLLVPALCPRWETQPSSAKGS